MLWGQNKKIRDALESILLRVCHIEHSIESIRDNARQTHIDLSDKQKVAHEKLDGLKEDIAKLIPVKKSKYVKKTKTVSPTI